MLSIKVVGVLCCLIVIAAAVPETVQGGVKQLSGDDLKEANLELQECLAKFATDDGPHYEISIVYSTTGQEIVGWRANTKCDLKNNEGHVKKCEVSIFQRLEYSTEVTVDCEGEKTVVNLV